VRGSVSHAGKQKDEVSMATVIERPRDDEYFSYYADYVDRVPQEDVLDVLAAQPGIFDELLGNLTDVEARFSFAPGEWSIKEVVGHVVDAERTFTYRAFAFSRGTTEELPSMEQDDYVREGHFDDWSLPEMLEELRLLRQANLITFRHITPEASLRQGVASGIEVSVRALVYILAGHFIYHVEDLTEKYLPGLAE
jgi:hypothetical protein